MRIHFTARHFKATDKLKDFSEKKVSKLKKYYDGIVDCEIVLDYEKKTQIAEIALSVNGQHLRVVERTEDIYKSIDLAVDKLERQLKKYKGKLREHGHERLADRHNEVSSI